MIELLAVDGAATVQDAGRPGLAHLGVSPSGAADWASAAAANAAVANPEFSAVVECVGILRVRTLSAATLAVVCGEVHGPMRLGAGHSIELGGPGVFSYLAVAGGLDVAPVLGSRSHDSLSGLGPPPLKAGDQLPIGAVQNASPPAQPLPPTPVGASHLVLDVLPGPRADWFASGLHGTTWRVSARANRVGIRLEGPPLRRASAYEGVELLSEGCVRGSIQVPASGQPIVFGPDHPTTGGYPVIGVLPAWASDALAQAHPGTPITFRQC